MNYIITKSCNKGCPYCFARESRAEDPKSVMTLENFKKYMHKYNDNNIKLLGGEPTQHPDFLNFLNLIFEEKKKAVIISNFLFKENILDGILEYLDKMDINFLVNGTDLDINNRMSIWGNNYKKIYYKLYSRNMEDRISVGITIDDSKDLSYYINYLNFLIKNTPKIERLRISLNFPGSIENKNPYNVINNKALGEKMLTLVQICLDNYISPVLDCVLYPCLFENKEEIKILNKFMEKLSFNCNGSPTDIFPDGSVEHCYPLVHSVGEKADNTYTSVGELQDSLKIRYNILKSTVEVPKECQECEHYNLGICSGPSLCFFKFNEFE